MQSRHETNFDQIRADSQRVRADFLKTDLQTGLALAALAKTHYSIGDTESGDRERDMAIRAYDAVLSHQNQIEWNNDEDVLRVAEKRAELEGAISALKNR